MLLALLKQPDFHPEKTETLQTVTLAGTIIPPDVVAAATDPTLLGAREAVVVYGMTEGLPICSSSSKKLMESHRGAMSLGKPLPGAKIRVCEHGSRLIVARGETGELHLSGDMVIDGYLRGDNEPFYTDESGDWMATGDQAMMDLEGNIFVLGRYKDVIIRGGENLSPALIENCLRRAGVTVREEFKFHRRG